MKLTDDSIMRISLGDRAERYVRDSKDTGFSLRLRRAADGSIKRTFLVNYEVQAGAGKRRRRKVFIGDHPTFSVEQARAEARRMLMAHQRGEDPRAERREKAAAPTLAEYADLLFAGDEFDALKATTRTDYRNRLERVLKPAFGDLRVRDIDRASIATWHRRGRAKLYDANRSLALLAKLMRLAIRDGLREDNPCAGIAKHRESARERWLDEHDLPVFLKALDADQTAYGECIRFLTVTGWRVSEALGLRWDMVDLPRLMARLPDTKTGAQARALSADAAALVDRQDHRVGYVFSNRRGAQPLGYKGLRAALAAVCDRAGIEQVRPHDLRHTAATWAAIEGAQAHELREAFGWRTLAMTERYVSRADALARKGAEKAAAAINIFGREGAEVRKAR